ncbi:MAG: transcriptional regulator [Bauldia sp.]|nr:transcriptional regulator [Bauldia sp.]
MSTAWYRDLRRLAARHARRAGEADDLVQDALVAALASGRSDLDDPRVRAWLAGTIRNRAAFDARSAVRRRQREAAWLAGREMTTAIPAPTAALPPLPRGLRAVLALVLTGHDRREIAYLLRLKEPALRQRFVALRKALRAAGAEMPAEFDQLRAGLDHGTIRLALGRLLSARPGRLASHDPDGHLFIIASSPASQIGWARQRRTVTDTAKDQP